MFNGRTMVINAERKEIIEEIVFLIWPVSKNLALAVERVREERRNELRNELMKMSIEDVRAKLKKTREL